MLETLHEQSDRACAQYLLDVLLSDDLQQGLGKLYALDCTEKHNRLNFDQPRLTNILHSASRGSLAGEGCWAPLRPADHSMDVNRRSAVLPQSDLTA